MPKRPETKVVATNAAQEREIIQIVLDSEQLSGLPLLWIKSRLRLIRDGETPNKVFQPQGREVQKVKNKVAKAELSLAILEKINNGMRVLEAQHAVAEEYASSFDTVQKAWAELGKFLRESLPRNKCG